MYIWYLYLGRQHPDLTLTIPHHRARQTPYIPVLCTVIYGVYGAMTLCETIFFANSEGTGLSIQSRMSFSNLSIGRILQRFVGSASSPPSYLSTFSTVQKALQNRISLILDLIICWHQMCCKLICHLQVIFYWLAQTTHLKPEHWITELSSTTLLLRSGFIYQVPFYSTF